MQNLKHCPCGEIPKSLHIADNGSKWAYVSGDCCNEWSIEFRTQYHRIETDECASLAVEAWNAAERSSLLTKRAADGLCTCRKNFEGAIIKVDPNCPLVIAAHR